MNKLIATYVRWVDALTEGIGKLLTWLPLTMALLTALVVMVRHALDSGSIALQETVMYAHGLALLLGISVALKSNAHVRVDLLHNRFSPAQRRWVNIFGHLVFLLPLCITLVWVSTPYVMASWRVWEGSPEVGGIPAVFLLKTLLPVAATLVALQALAEVMRECLRLPKAADPTMRSASPQGDA